MPLSLPTSLSTPNLSLRIACALVMATTLAACQTSGVGTSSAQTAQNVEALETSSQNSSTQTNTNQKSTDTNTKKSSALTIDMSGRHEYQLENGLKVVIKEDHRSPVVMTQIWYPRWLGR